MKFTSSSVIVTYAPYAVWKTKEVNSANGKPLSLLKLLTVFTSFIFTGFFLLNANWKLGGGDTGTQL